ncbi:MAG: hypothetical protein LCH89_12160 [Proteobacteria bacterium]|nr:hypothetical protein [Pseudomonadota bacterium]
MKRSRSRSQAPRRLMAPARLVARLYHSASASARVTAVRSLLRPLSPLALAVVADGAFAFVLTGEADESLRLAAVARAQVAELADFAYQVDPATLVRAAELLATPAAGTAFAAAVLALLMRKLAAPWGRVTPR